MPLASGSLDGDFLATFVGALYRSELWTFTSRLENRHSDAEDRRIVSGGFYREPIAGHAFSMTAHWFDSTFANGSDATAGEVQLGWSYRPATSALDHPRSPRPEAGRAQRLRRATSSRRA